MIIEKEGSLSGARGAKVHFHYWQPEEGARAVLLLSHGAAEHCDRYAHVAAFFAAQGFATAGLDHPGHGRSDGHRGFIDDFDDYVSTLRSFHQQVKNDFPGLPVILLGHSMGGLISTCYLLEYQDEITACVLSGPAIKTELEPGVLQMFLIKLLSALLPRFGALQLDATGVCRDEAVVEHYRNDPLVYSGKLSARLVAQLFKAMTRVQEQAGTIRVPMLMMHGGQDSMASPEGSRFLHQSVASPSRELKIYPELFHEIFNEPEQEQVFADMLNWLDQHVPPADGQQATD